MNRLISAQTTGPEWAQRFGYDGFGNLLSQTVTKGSAPSMSATVNPATNRITNSGMSYDANGNLTAMPGLTMTYDTDNRMLSNSSGDTYQYDAAGQRVQKKNGQTTSVYFYGIDGNLLNAPASYNVYFGNKLIYNGTAVVTDRLGSVVHKDQWTATRYFPYGDDPAATQQDRPKFATYYRDSSTALDYAQQRYYASTLARFTTPDPYQASGGPADPQSWNRYAYVQNDPVNYFDPGGLNMCPAGSENFCVDVVGTMSSVWGGVMTTDSITFIRMFYLLYFQSLVSGDGGGGNYDVGGGGPAGPPRVDAKTDSIAGRLLHLAIQSLRSTRCNTVLPLDTIASKGRQMHFYDARPSSPYAAVTQDYVSGNGDFTPLGNTPIGRPGADAAVLRGQDNSLLPVAVLRTNWWGAMSGGILLHETMHYALQRTDGELFRYLGQRGFRFNGDPNDTDQMSVWLDDGCPNQNGTRRSTDRIGRHTW